MPTRFRLANRPKTDEEKFKNLQTKLENTISETEEKGKYVRKFALESRLGDCSDEEGVEEVAKLSRVLGQNIQCNKKNSELTKKNLDLIESLMGLAVDKCQSKVSEVTSDDQCRKTWSVEVRPNVKHDVRILQEFVTNEVVGGQNDGMLPTITQLKLKVTGLEMGMAELEEVTELCEKECEVQLFTRIVREYLVMHETRKTVIDKVLEGNSDLVVQKDFNKMEISDTGGELLCTLTFPMLFNYRSLGWKTPQVWSCEFTEAGKIGAASVNIPQSVVETGTTANWSQEEAGANLVKLARLNDDDGESDLSELAPVQLEKQFDTCIPEKTPKPPKPAKMPKRKL